MARNTKCDVNYESLPYFSTFRAHLKSEHPAEYELYYPTQEAIPNKVFKQDIADRLLIKTFIGSSPSSFSNFIAYVNPSYDISEETLRSRIEDEAVRAYKVIERTLASASKVKIKTLF